MLAGSGLRRRHENDRRGLVRLRRRRLSRLSERVDALIWWAWAWSWWWAALPQPCKRRLRDVSKSHPCQERAERQGSRPHPMARLGAIRRKPLSRSSDAPPSVSISPFGLRGPVRPFERTAASLRDHPRVVAPVTFQRPGTQVSLSAIVQQHGYSVALRRTRRAAHHKVHQQSEMYSPRRYFPQRNLAGHHLLTFYLRELSIVARKLRAAELALTIRPGRGHGLARRVARADCGLALVWRGVAVRNRRLRLRSGLGEGTRSTGAG